MRPWPPFKALQCALLAEIWGEESTYDSNACSRLVTRSLQKIVAVEADVGASWTPT